MIKNKTFKEMFNINIPKGILYYPCCGDDKYEPISLFRDSIDEFHFSDINSKRLCLPNTEAPYNKINKDIKFNNEKVDFYCNIITNSKMLESYIYNNYINDSFKKYYKFNFGACRVQDKVKKYMCTLNTENQRNIQIITHCLDSAITLMLLENISVFFYRRDSPGEGGSGQWWMGEELLRILTDKMVDGGIILTDGSNPNPEERYVPWKALISGDKKEDFQYFERSFEYIGKVESEIRSVHAWRVRKIF